MMRIAFDRICPLPLLKDGEVPPSDVWGQACVFEQGENYLLRAPSGRGKSTFLHILYGLRKDFRGRLLIDGRDSAELGVDDWLQLRREKLAMVFQDLRLFPQLTALENIQLNAALVPIKSEAEIRQMAASLDMAALLPQKAQTLSYGQQQRVAIIRALCQPFSLLLLDEPFSHLDQQNIEKASALIQSECQQQGAGLLLLSLGEDSSFSFSNTQKL